MSCQCQKRHPATTPRIQCGLQTWSPRTTAHNHRDCQVHIHQSTDYSVTATHYIRTHTPFITKKILCCASQSTPTLELVIVSHTISDIHGFSLCLTQFMLSVHHLAIPCLLTMFLYCNIDYYASVLNKAIAYLHLHLCHLTKYHGLIKLLDSMECTMGRRL